MSAQLESTPSNAEVMMERMLSAAEEWSLSREAPEGDNNEEWDDFLAYLRSAARTFWGKYSGEVSPKRTEAAGRLREMAGEEDDRTRSEFYKALAGVMTEGDKE